MRSADPLRGAVLRVWLIVIGFAAITLVRSRQVGIPLRDPHGGIFWARLAVFFVLTAALALTSAAVRTPAPPSPARVWQTLRSHWDRTRLILVATGLVAYQIVYLCYHNLKSWDVFNHPRDAMLLQWDRWLFLGHSPAVLLHQLLGQQGAAYTLMNVYESFTAVTSLMLVAALVIPARVADAYVYLASGLWVWILGVGSYYLIPSLGPFNSAPGQFAGLPHTMIQRTQDYYMGQRAQMLAHPSWPGSFAQVSAFASLHVAVTCLAFLMARYYGWRIVSWALGAFLVVTMVATVYLGWHFAVDDLAGLAIAGVGVVLGRLTIYPRWRRTEPESARASSGSSSCRSTAASRAVSASPGAPRFTVVVPALNESLDIGACLSSLAAQDFAGPVEVVVVDNNSVDGTDEIARTWGARVLYESEPGVCGARQRGTESATGEIVVSTDADTTFDRGWLSRIDAAFADDSVVAVAGPCQFIDGPWWARPYSSMLFAIVNLIYLATGRVVYVTATNLAFRRSAWTGYDRTLTQGGDELDQLRRLRRQGAVKFVRCNSAYTSSRRLGRGLVYSIFVTCIYHYFVTYGVNRVAGRRVLGTAPAIRGTASVPSLRWAWSAGATGFVLLSLVVAGRFGLERA